MPESQVNGATVLQNLFAVPENTAASDDLHYDFETQLLHEWKVVLVGMS